MRKWILIATLVLCSFLLAPYNYDGPLVIRHIAWCVLTMVMVLCAKDFRVGTIHIFAVGYLLCVLLSGVFAVNKSEWFYWALRASLMVTFLSVAVIDKKLIAKTMMLIGVLFVCRFWYDHYHDVQLDCTNFDAIVGFMKQKNYWAAAHFFVIPFCFTGVWKKLAIPLAIALAANIILLNSRSGIVCLFVVSCTIFVLYKKSRWFFAGLLLTGLCGTGIIYLLKMDIRNFLPANALNYDSLHQRFEQWIPTLKMIWQNPFGVGAGNWWIVFPTYAPAIDFPDAYLRVSFRFPHNDFLWVWAETGWLGIICYLGMLGTALWSAIKSKSNYLIIALIGYMTLAFFTACRERPFASLMMMVFILLACPRPYKIKCQKWVLIPLTLLLVVLGFQYRASCWNKRLTHVETFPEKLWAAQGYSVLTTLTYTGVPYIWWSGMVNYKQRHIELAINQFEKAYEHNPGNVHVINGKGISRMHQGKPDEAKTYFEEALRICPDFGDAKRNLEMLNR